MTTPPATPCTVTPSSSDSTDPPSVPLQLTHMTCIFHIVRFDPCQETMLQGFTGTNAKETWERADARLEHWWNKFPNACIDITRKA